MSQTALLFVLGVMVWCHDDNDENDDHNVDDYKGLQPRAACCEPTLSPTDGPSYNTEKYLPFHKPLHHFFLFFHHGCKLLEHTSQFYDALFNILHCVCSTLYVAVLQSQKDVWTLKGFCQPLGKFIGNFFSFAGSTKMESQFKTVPVGGPISDGYTWTNTLCCPLRSF